MSSFQLPLLHLLDYLEIQSDDCCIVHVDIALQIDYLIFFMILLVVDA